ncbi:hypothetical protein [Rhodobium gokarnense]|uniref:Uncharacterized protein n=1 Tax=Rhodobium gokarnense TaxID=364296 RepID=A0ABT3HHJ1_9HYPH|nr:hypothetical protein [Rhodobium gokarnense]MCW2309721.1 hypothetical protein [Rhodobium gokarnense]
MTDKVQSLAMARSVAACDNTLISPPECLEEAAREIRSGERACTSVFVLTLDAGLDGDEFGVGYYASNLKASQMLAMLEVMKARVLTSMGHIAAPEQ